MREIEEKLTELQGQYHTLSQSYDTLQLEYSAVKEELGCLRRQHESDSPIRGDFSSCLREWHEAAGENPDPLMFDASVFCCDAEGYQN